MSDPAVVGTPAKVSAIAGTLFSGAVATFTDPGGVEPNDGTHYSASIDWGDKTAVTTGTISLNGSTFTVSGSHTYASAGSYTVTCTVNHEGVMTTVTSPATITTGGTTAPVVTCIAITPIAGAPFNGVVATFTDADGDPLSHFSAAITWGDGTTSSGTITANGQGGFNVSGSHTYASAHVSSLGVQISDTDGTSGSGTCPIKVTVLGSFATAKQTATLNFWNGTRGQALITSFNGGASSTALSSWLAGFSNLWGATAGANNLTGKTNAQVAAFFQTLYAAASPKADAQALALALNIYATTLSLGGTAGTAYGFSVTATGLGASLVLLGSNGPAFDSPNNVGVTAYQLLKATNAHAVTGVLYNGDSVLLQEFLNVVAKLNGMGING